MVWWQYLGLVNIYLLLFYGFYSLLLRKETFFQLNRLYLVSAALLSFLIPLMQAAWVKNLFITRVVHSTIYGATGVTYQLSPGAAHSYISIGQVLALLYFAGVLFLAIRFVWQLILVNKAINNPVQNSPYSFFKTIKLDEQLNGSQVIATHEQVHAKQWHSADVLIIEAVMIINWFNPVVYFYRRAIKRTHEFIADSHTLKTGANKADYAMLLLSQTFNTPSHQLVSHFFNHSLLKQRIMMLQKNRSQRIMLIKYGLSAPLFVLMLILSSATVNTSKAVAKVNRIAFKVFETPANTAFMAKVKYITVTAKSNDSTITEEKINKINSNIKLEIAAQVKKERTNTAQTDTTTRQDGPLFTAVEVEPQFIGNFGSFLAKNINYPADAREQKIQGRVIVSFVVEKDGSLSNIKVLREPSASLGEEAARIIALSPKWSPGVQNGYAVRVQFTVPIQFALDADHMIKPDNQESLGLSRDTVKKTLNLQLTRLNDVMVIVDGKEVKYENLQQIDPNSIKSISIYRDKTAIAMYGTKAANGVIVVSTKK